MGDKDANCGVNLIQLRARFVKQRREVPAGTVVMVISIKRLKEYLTPFRTLRHLAPNTNHEATTSERTLTPAWITKRH